MVDEYRLRAEAAELELSRSERVLQEVQQTNADLKTKRAESEKQRVLLLEKLHKASHQSSSGPQKDEERQQLELENIRLTQSREILEKELAALGKSLRSQKQINADVLEELDKMRAEVSRLKQEKNFFHRDMSLQESERTELQLQELRRELTRTVDDWKDVETTKDTLEELSGQANARLEREKEKNSLLQTQVTLLEDRLDLLSQELAVFRSLDIYHTSMDAEMRQYRKAATSPLPRRGLRSVSPTDRLRTPSDRTVPGKYRGSSASEASMRNELLDDSSDDDENLARRYPPIRSERDIASEPYFLNASSTTASALGRTADKALRWGDSNHSNGDDDLGPSLALSDMSPLHNGRPSRIRDDITPSLTGSAQKGKARYGAENGAHRREPSRSPSPSGKTSSHRSERHDLGQLYRESGRGSISLVPPKHSQATYDNDVELSPVPKRESVSRPDLQLDGSLKRSSHHPVSASSRTSRGASSGEFSGREASTRIHSNLLARSSRDNSKGTSSKPSKVEFERAKRLLARR